MEELERLADLDDEARMLDESPQLPRQEGRLVLRLVEAPGDEADVLHRPDLRVRHVRFAEGEAAPGEEQRKRAPQTEIHVDVVEDADADNRVEPPALQSLAGLDVPDDDLRALSQSLAAARGGRIAELDGDEGAPRLGDASRELARAAPELEAAHPRPEPRCLDEELGAALGADLAGRARPAPDSLEPSRDDLVAPTALLRIAQGAAFRGEWVSQRCWLL